MNIRILHDLVLVRVVDVPSVTTSGIILQTADIPCKGKVLAVGPGKLNKDGTREEHGVLVGHTVLFGASALQQPVEDHPGHYLMRAEHIYGKVDV